MVEDDLEIADFLVRGLREEGFNVVLASDGEAGRHRLQGEPWDVVLLDWWLPTVDGLTLLREFRQHDANTPVPRALLQKFDAAADWLGLDDELLESLVAELK